jgi:hypothetical protein
LFYKAHERGALSVAAAGNDGSTSKNYPASYDKVISVAAVDDTKKRASFSQSNNFVDISASGVRVASTYLGDRYAYLSGTSMAAPHITGAIARIWPTCPECSNDQVEQCLISTAEDLGPVGRDNEYGAGLLQTQNAYDCMMMGCCGASPGPTPVPTPGPTLGPTPVPTAVPTLVPTAVPTTGPTAAPTPGPSPVPTPVPTPGPTAAPTPGPSLVPTPVPTLVPTPVPTLVPTSVPTPGPTLVPTPVPASGPSSVPTPVPTTVPTPAPTSRPSPVPTPGPTSGPTLNITPSTAPSSSHSVAPSRPPSASPSSIPSTSPSDVPSTMPSGSPSNFPSSSPSTRPSVWPSSGPSSTPSVGPSLGPSTAPSTTPSSSPSAAQPTCETYDYEFPVDLGYACNYAILAKTGISTVPISDITGDIAVSPIAAGAMTGFTMTLDSSGQFSTSTQVTGKAFAANYAAPTPGYLSDAVSDMQAAYNDAAARSNTDASRKNIGGGTIGGQTFFPGVYTWTSGLTIASDITFEGGPDDVFIMQIETSLYQTANMHVLLAGCAQAKNIFWLVKTSTYIGADASMQGIILGATAVDMITSSVLVGSILTQTRANLGKATITQQDTCTLGFGPTTAPSPAPLCRSYGSSCVSNEDCCDNACSGLARVCN